MGAAGSTEGSTDVGPTSLEEFEEHLNRPPEVLFESANLPTELWTGNSQWKSSGHKSLTPNDEREKFEDILVSDMRYPHNVPSVTFIRWDSHLIIIKDTFMEIEKKYRWAYMLWCYARFLRVYYENEHLKRERGESRVESHVAYLALIDIVRVDTFTIRERFVSDEAVDVCNMLIRFCIKVMGEIEGGTPQHCPLTLDELADKLGVVMHATKFAGRPAIMGDDAV